MKPSQETHFGSIQMLSPILMRSRLRKSALTGPRGFSLIACLVLLLFSSFLSPGASGRSVAGISQQLATGGGPIVNDAPQLATASPIKIATVTREPDDGAGCSLQLPADYKKQNERNIFNSSYENSSEDCACAFMNIDGRDVKLTRVYSKWPPGGDNKVGNRGVQVYASGQIRVQVDYVVTPVCGPRDGEDCESTEFSATIKVTRRGVSTTLSVRGICGV